MKTQRVDDFWIFRKTRLQAIVLTLVLISQTVVDFGFAFDSIGYGQSEENCKPQHVHLAYGDALTEMVVMWATKGNCSTLVEYGASEWSLNQRTDGTSNHFVEHNDKGLQYLHRVKLTDLQHSTTYFYRPMSGSVGKGPFYFKIPPPHQNWSPDFLVFGDLGVHTETILSLVEEALSGDYTALLHVGDFAYNLHDDDGLIGDKFFELIEPVAAFLPYMTCPGNHEIDGDTFTHYRHRFSMPQAEWPMHVDRLWYSFDVGPVHFISYSSEVFFTFEQRLVQTQHDWLLDDLEKANAQRGERPWVIAFGHRPLYCSSNDGDDCTKNDSLVRAGLEDVFYNGKVDMVLQAHEHNYERLYPTYKGQVLSHNYTDPPAPVQIISGAAGSKHLWDVFQPPPKPEWSAMRADRTAFNSYGRLRVFNATHAYWEQRSVHNHAVMDSVWIIQQRNGSFNFTTTNTKNNSTNKNNISATTNNNSTNTNNITRNENENKESLITTDTTQRIAIGASFGVGFLILLIVVVAVRVRQRKRGRLTRRYKPVDLDYGKRVGGGYLDDEYDDDDEGFGGGRLVM